MAEDVIEESVKPSATARQLQAFLERVERLELEKREIAEQIKEVYAEARANGYDVKALRKIVMLRRKPEDDRREEEAILQLYMDTLGMN